MKTDTQYERKQAEQSLIASETRYRRLFETAKDGILILDARTGMIVDVNPFLVELLGFSHELFLGKKIWELGFFKDIVANQDKFAELQQKEYVRYDNLDLETANGKKIQVEFVSNVYLVNDEKVIQCNIRDITERKRAEKQERLARNVLDRLNHPESSGDIIRDILAMIQKHTGIEASGIRLSKGDDFPYYQTKGFSDHFIQMENHLCAYDETGKLLRDPEGNPILECMCGNILRGRTNPDLPFFTEGGSFWSNCTTDLLAKTTEKDRQAHTRNRCNREGYESVALIPLRSGAQIVGLLQLNDHRPNRFTPDIIRFFEGLSASIGIALTRKQTEEALRELNLQLEHSLGELKLTQRKIIQQERLSAIGQMASGIAHDFNNALMPIVGFSELLLSDPPILDNRKEVTRLLEMILQAGNDARQIVRRLRAVYRDNGDNHYKMLDLSKIVESAISLTMPKWKEELNAKGVTVEMVTDFSPIPQFKGNESEMREALTNLIFNAVDAMPKGGVITFRTFRNNAISIVLEVTDTGLGMDQETLRRCVEPFFTTKGVHGSGLGLAMVHGIVARHDGAVEIKSAAGFGTTIRILLPVPATGDIKKKIETESEQLPPLRILVIDDEERSRNLLESFLKADAHLVELAVDASEGLALLQQRAFDLIITDRAMPLMSGDEAAIEAQKIRPGIPIIMLTGFGDIMKDNAECPSGVNRVLSKPISRQDLRRAMTEIIGKVQIRATVLGG